MTRGGQKKTRNGAERRCIATQSSFGVEQLIRFVLSPEGVVTPDLAAKLPGRGIWVQANRTAMETAITKNAFSRAAKAQATIPEGLNDLVIELMLKRAVEALSLCRKAGLAIVGFDSTLSAMVSGKASVLVQASDGSEGQKKKIRPNEGENGYISCLNSAELGLAFAREHVIHAALMPGALTDRTLQEAKRLAGLRGTTSEAGNQNPAY